MDELSSTQLTTRIDGSYGGTMEMNQVGAKYEVFAFYYGGSDYENSNSQTRNFTVVPVINHEVSPTGPSLTQPEPDYSGGMALLFIIIIVVIVAIAIKKRKKKTPMVVPPPSGGVSQTRKSPGAPFVGKFRKSKRGIRPKLVKAQLRDKTHYLRCKDCKKEAFLIDEADGHQLCTKCGWVKK